MSIPPGRRRSVLHPRPLQPRATTARRAPDREDDDQLPKLIDREVDMVPGLGHEHAPDRLAALGRIHRADGRGAGDQLPRLGELTSEEVASPGPVLTPPCVHLGRLALGLRREDELHSRASSLPMTASPSTSCPARACAMLRSRAASRRVRSSGSKSSSSITVSSTSAPSGRSVGSSSTTRPPRTCAFSALIAPRGRSPSRGRSRAPQRESARGARARSLDSTFFLRAEGRGLAQRSRRSTPPRQTPASPRTATSRIAGAEANPSNRAPSVHRGRRLYRPEGAEIEPLPPL